MNTLNPKTITDLTVIYSDDPDASWASCADGWRHEAESNGFPAEIIGEDADGTPIVSHDDEHYMLRRYHEADDWFITALTIAVYRRSGWAGPGGLGCCRSWGKPARRLCHLGAVQRFLESPPKNTSPYSLSM